MLNTDFFNFGMRRLGIEQLNRAQEKYEKQAAETRKLVLDLFEVRRATSEYCPIAVETYINTLDHIPMEYIRIVSEYRVHAESFGNLIDEVLAGDSKNVIDRLSGAAFPQEINPCLKSSDSVDLKAGAMAGVGAGAGAAVAAFAPTAAMAVATTFGTASTGTAIAALSGAASSGAALAWLGGGALVAGGGGMAAGEALLALTGPVGWAIGTAAVIGTGLWMRGENAHIASEAQKLAAEIEGNINVLKVAAKGIADLMRATKIEATVFAEHLAWLKANPTADYVVFGRNHIIHLEALINNVKSLSALLNKTVVL